MRRRGDLLAFADDMLVMSSQKGEIEQAITELTSLQLKYNLRLNKKKSEILGPGPGKSAQCQEFPYNGYSPGCSQP